MTYMKRERGKKGSLGRNKGRGEKGRTSKEREKWEGTLHGV